MTMSEWFVSVYLPVKGWAMVVYGPEGPEYTGMGGSLAQALHDAINESNDTGYELQVHDLYFCPECKRIAMRTEKCACDYMPKQYTERQRKWDALRAKFEANNLHNGPLDQEIFGRVA